MALHSPGHNRFLRVKGDSVDANGGDKDIDQLPAGWQDERLLAVDYDGRCALYSEAHKRFVRLEGSGAVNAKGGAGLDAQALPADRLMERFRIVVVG